MGKKNKKTKDKKVKNAGKPEELNKAVSGAENAPDAEGTDSPEKTPEKNRVVDPKVLEQRRKQRIRRRRIAVAIIALLLVAGIIVLLWKLGVFNKKDPDKVLTPVVTKVEYTPRGEYLLGAVDGILVICDENGVTGIDPEGKWKWNSTLSAYDPVFSGAENMILVTDQGGRSIWAFNGSGQLWRYVSENKLICAYVADPTAGKDSSGYSTSDIITICEQEDFESSLTLLSQTKGKLTERFTRKFGKYHMLSAAGSKDRTQLAASGVYYEGGTLSGCTVFIRSSDGEVYSTIISDGQVYLQLRYLDDGTLFAANSDSLRLIRKLPAVSGSGDVEKELWTRSGDRKFIADTCVAGGNSFAAAFSDDNVSGVGGMSEIRRYDRSGNVTGTTEIAGNVKGLESFSGFLAAFTDDKVFLINPGGNIIGTGEFDSQISDAAFMDSRTLAVNTASGIFILSFEG